MLTPEPSKRKLDLLNETNWLRIGKIFVFLSGRVFKEIQPPHTPFLVPLFFVCVASATILWVIVPLILDTYGIGLDTIDNVQRPDGKLQVGELAQNVIFEMPIAMFNYTLGMLLLGTYYFGIARLFRIDDIWWEHWFAFAWWTHVPLILVLGAARFIDVYSVTVDPSLGVSLIVVGLCFLLPIVWTVNLSVQGLRIWTEKGWLFSLGVSVLPYLVVILAYAQSIVDMFMRAWA